MTRLEHINSAVGTNQPYARRENRTTARKGREAASMKGVRAVDPSTQKQRKAAGQRQARRVVLTEGGRERRRRRRTEAAQGLHGSPAQVAGRWGATGGSEEEGARWSFCWGGEDDWLRMEEGAGGCGRLDDT